MKLYSNGPDAIQFLTARPAVTIPCVTNPETLRPNPEYSAQLQTMLRETIAGTAIVVCFTNVNWRWYLPSRKQLELGENLPVFKQLDDGTIFASPNKM